MSRLRPSVFLAVVVLVPLIAACGTKSPMEEPVSDLAGPADGAHVVVFYGSEIMGSLEGCGCMGNPKLGGFPYRMAVTRAFEAANPSVGTLSMDAGFTSSLITTQQSSVSTEAVAGSETGYLALLESDFAAVNVTGNDIAAARGYFAASGANDRFRRLLVSANLEPLSSAYRAPEPFVTRRVKRPGGSGFVDVAVVGVSDSAVALDPSVGFRLTEPGPALERAIAAARSQADVVVVLAYMTAAAADRVLRKLVAKPDVVIVANSFGAGSADGSVMGAGLEPRLEGPMRVVYSWYKTQKLGVLKLTLDDANRVVSAANSYVKLEAPIVPDATAEAMVSRQRDAVRAAKEARYRAEGVQASNAAE